MILTVVVPLPDELPTANRRWHWSKRSRVTGEMRLAARLCGTSARNSQGMPAAAGKRYVSATLTRKKSQGRRMYDPDNATGILKPFLDGFRDARVLEADDPSHLALVALEQEWGTRDYVTFRVAETLTEIAA